MANLILVRHGQSQWNEKGLWTGLTDIGLTEKGREEARFAGNKIKGLAIDFAFTSALSRAEQTLEEIKGVLGIDVPTIRTEALNERDYGVFTGKNKWEIQKQVGDVQFKNIRRGWDVGIENGESLKDVFSRVVPYFQTEILPKIQSGKNVIIVAHGNSLRALVKYLENISDEDIANLEIATGQVYVYNLDEKGAIVSKEIR
jgi:2,3-bisphosphoglycerate-dependent phosphoglycerate mutase